MRDDPELLMTAPESKEVGLNRPTSHRLILPDEIYSLLPRQLLVFEHYDSAIKEDSWRIKSLHKLLNIREQLLPNHSDDLSQERIEPYTWLNAEQCRYVIELLEQGIENEIPQRTLASSLMWRLIRAAIIDQVTSAFFELYEVENLKTFTILNTRWVKPSNDLMSYKAKKLKDQFKNDLRQSGIDSVKGPLIAFLNGEYESTNDVFTLHLHGLTTAEKSKKLLDLTKLPGYESTFTGADPIKSVSIHNQKDQLSYPFQAFWPHKPIINGQRVRRRGRIPEPYHSLVLLWLDRQSLLDLTVTEGCWSRKAGGTENMRILNLIIERLSRSLARNGL